MKRPTLVMVTGPTASGKSGLAVALAQHYGTEIISADSRQVFRGLPIGTAQPTAAQLAAVPHHFIATEELDSPYTCGMYERQALATLDDLFPRHDIVIAAGGSGMYVDALCEGMDTIPPADPEVRTQLNRRLADEGIDALAEQLRTLDPEYYARVDHSNPRRIVRALEVCLSNGAPYSSLRRGNNLRREQGDEAGRSFDVIKIGTLLDREELYRRIDSRVDAMMMVGLEAEARALYPMRRLNSLQTVGYRELFDWFDGTTDLPRAVELIKRNSRRYAKRQMTWLRRDNRIVWLDPGDIVRIIEYIDSQR